MRKEYVSPLFEEVVLMTEDVLDISDNALENMGSDNGGENTDDEENVDVTF